MLYNVERFTFAPSFSSLTTTSSTVVFDVFTLIVVVFLLYTLLSIFFVVSMPNLSIHISTIHKGIEYSISSLSFSFSGYFMESIFLAIFLTTPFTNPLKLENFLFFANLTASLQTADSGTLSIYLSW